MLETSRPRLVVTILFAIAALACDEAGPTPFDGMTPVASGTIVSRAPIQGHSGMTIFEDGLTAEQRYCSGGVYWIFGPGMQVFRNGVRKQVSDLKIGQHVSVFGMMANNKGCSPPGMADAVLVH